MWTASFRLPQPFISAAALWRPLVKLIFFLSSVVQRDPLISVHLSFVSVPFDSSLELSRNDMWKENQSENKTKKSGKLSDSQTKPVTSWNSLYQCFIYHSENLCFVYVLFICITFILRPYLLLYANVCTNHVCIQFSIISLNIPPHFFYWNMSIIELNPKPCDSLWPLQTLNVPWLCPVWLTGVLVVNVTWRKRTYVGTLLDCTKHDWAPPR